MSFRLWTKRLWPRSLATRTALVLLAGLMLVQVAGLTIHALDRIDVQEVAQMREIARRVFGFYRAVAITPPEQRAEVLAALPPGPGLTVELSHAPPVTDLPEMGPPAIRRFWADMNFGMLPGLGPQHPEFSPRGPPGQGLPGQRPPDAQANGDHPTERPPPPRPFGAGPPGRPQGLAFGGPQFHQMVFGLRLRDGEWLNFTAAIERPRPWHSATFLAAFGLMTAVAAGLTLWAVRRLTAPVRTLAAAAEALGRDVNAPPLPEGGPLEVATAAAAFNTMADRIRRFVQDRTELLTAIGHDLRTPITRLKLRAEFLDDDEQRTKILNDLEELEAMVAATLAFGRDVRTTEPVVSLDLVELLRTVLDEAGDARPDAVDKIDYTGPEHLTVRVRSLALKRALANLVANAVAYGGSAHVRLTPPAGSGGAAHSVSVEIEDDGPGIPPAELDRVFEPFHRVETSRNRETGGTGLGLPIARNIMRAHGGDVTLANRPGGGARAVVTLPV